MTCTHVVADCVDGPLDNAVVECSFPGTPDHRAKLRVTRYYPTVAVAGDASARRLRDIALLELEPGSTFPPDFHSVSSKFSSIDQPVDFFGTGIMKGYPDGIQIAGKTGESGEPSRVFVASVHADQAVQQGCSGTAVFHGHDGLVGMVAEVQQFATALIVPIDILREVYPIRGAAAETLATTTAGPGSATTAEPLNKRMLRAFSDFDRHDQSADFRDAFDRKWNQNRSVMLCAIAGLDDDVPSHCRDKFRHYDLKDFLRRNSIAASKIDALEISWPLNERKFDVERVFKRMKGVLAGYLRASGTEPAAIREALNSDLRQLIFYSQLDQRTFYSRPDQRTFGKSHLELLQKWAAYFNEIDDQAIVRPLIHFLIIKLDPEDFRPDSEEPNALLATFYREIIARTNRKMPEGSEIENTSLLNYFDIDFIDNWIEMNSDQVGLDERLAEEVREVARQTFPQANYIRLKDVGNWMKSLAG